eukprot:2081768-Pleurochrysis_carterae.AAC.1
MSPAATGTGMCAFECTASLFAWRQSSHAKLRAIVAHAFGASRRACRSSAVIVVPLVDLWLSCVTTAGEAAVMVLAVGKTSTPTLISGTTCPSGRRR